MRKFILMTLIMMGTSIAAYSQACTIITDTYGPGTAPCNPNFTSTYTAFEVWPTEAYTFTGLTAGVTYRFSLAGGAAGAWTANYTVYNPSMTVVAFGTGDANNDITFTAAVAGTYTFGFFDVALGCGSFVQVDGGFATLTAVSGPIPACVTITTCEAGILSDDTPVTLPTITSTTNVNATGVIIPNSPTQGGQGVLFQPQAGGGGGLGGEFILTGVALPYTFDADLNGVLSGNGFPLLTGLYNVRPAVYADNANIFASICDTTFRARPVTFPTGGPVFCDGGAVSVGDQAVCPGDIWNLGAAGDSIPLGGDYAWFFFAVDTVANVDYGYFFGGSDYSGDLNADLAAAGLDTILPGVYEVIGAVYSVDGLCEVTEGSFFITVYDAADPVCSGCQSPTNLGVVQIGFGGTNPRVNATWTNLEGTTSCEVRGGRISTASYNAGEPEFVNITNTQIITATNGSTVNFNIALYNNPNIPFVVGSRYGYDVRCACADGSGFSEWANITPAATFVVPAPPAGINVYEGSKATVAEAKALSNLKNVENQMQVIGAPKQIKKAEVNMKRPSAASTKLLAKNTVSLFPNPAQNDLNISIDATSASNLDVMVYDMTGRVVIAEQMIVAKGLNAMTIDVQNLEKGMYVVAIGDVKQPFVKK